MFVLSSKPLNEVPPDTEHWTGGAEALVSHLRETVLDGDVWILGGPKTMQAFREIGAIDSYEIYVIPVILGSGIQLFSGSEDQSRLSLISSTALENGVVRLVYEPA